MATVVLDRLVSQNTPLPNIWKYVLGYLNNNSVPMKSLSNIFSRYLFNQEISKVSEIDKLQIALQVCAFYSELNNEETAQNIISLLLDSGVKHQECLEFLAFLTSVAASAQCALYLQTFGILASQDSVLEFVCQKLLSDHCVESQCYQQLYSIAKIAPQFTLHFLKHTLNQIVHTISTHETGSSNCAVPLHSLVIVSCNLVDQNESFLLQPEVFHAMLLTILLFPLFSLDLKLSKTKRTNFKKMNEKLFKTIFLKLSAGEAKVDYETLSKISELIKSFESSLKEAQDGKDNFAGKGRVSASKDHLNQIILITSHEKTSIDEQDTVAGLIQDTEFGEFLLESLKPS